MGLSLLSDVRGQRLQSMLRTALGSELGAALLDETVTELIANSDGSVWIERTRQDLSSIGISLGVSDRERIVRLVATGIGAPCGRDHPIVSAELPGTGERFEGLLPPVSEAPCFAIRKPAATAFSLSDFASIGMLPEAAAMALRACLQKHKNILVAGGTSSGKTTFCNALLSEPALKDDRVVILEDTRELNCSVANSVSLKTSRGAVSMSDLVRSTLRLRPDRIIVGEVRGSEALDMLKAWNTGHPGGLTTLHANSALAALTRLEHLTQEVLAYPPRELIADAIDIVVFLTRVSGVRRVGEIIKVSGLTQDGNYDTAPLVRRQLSLIDLGDHPCTHP
ncbi:MAG: P-type conjugative transfer ATPase TrbB [Hyphomonadaceae bacterium]